MAITLVVKSGNNQLIPANLGLSSKDIIINVLNGGSPVVGATLTFTATLNGGATTAPIGYPGSAVTDASGNLTVRVVAQTMVGAAPSTQVWVITATYSGSSTTFTETNYYNSGTLVPGVNFFRLLPSESDLNPYSAQAGVAGKPIKIQIWRADGIGGVPNVGVKLTANDAEVITSAEATGPELLVLTDANGIATLTPTFATANTALAAPFTFNIDMGRFNQYSPLNFLITSGAPAPSPDPSPALTVGGQAIVIPPDVAGYDFASCPVGDFGFEYGGKVYLFARKGGYGTPTGDQKLHALQSVDAGLTWAELDSANAPNPGNVSGFDIDFTVARDGAKVMLTYVRAHYIGPAPPQTIAIDGLTVVLFDLKTGKWGASTNYTVPTFSFCAPGVAIALTQSRQVVLRMVVRGCSDYLFFYSGTIETIGGVNYGRAYYCTFDGATFGAGVILPNQAGKTNWYFPSSAICDKLNNTHFSYLSNEVVAFNYSLKHVGLDPSNTFGVTQNITTEATFPDNTGKMSELILFSNNGPEQIAVGVQTSPADGSAGRQIAFCSAVAVLNPLWSTSIVSADAVYAALNQPNFNLISHEIAVGYFGGILSAVWAWYDAATTAGHFRYSQARAGGTLTWSAQLELFAPGLMADTGTGLTNEPLTSVQLISFVMSTGVGLVGISQDQASLAERAQFYLLPGFTGTTVTPAPPPTSTFGNVAY